MIEFIDGSKEDKVPVPKKRKEPKPSLPSIPMWQPSLTGVPKKREDPSLPSTPKCRPMRVPKKGEKFGLREIAELRRRGMHDDADRLLPFVRPISMDLIRELKRSGMHRAAERLLDEYHESLDLEQERLRNDYRDSDVHGPRANRPVPLNFGRLRKQRAARGACTQCGGWRSDDDFRMCLTCRRWARARKKKYR